MSGKKAAWDWKEEVRNGGSLREVELEKGVNGWASPPGDLFAVRGASYFSKKQKVAGGEWLMKPLGMDWLRSGSKLENVLGRPDSRVMRALRKAQAEGMALKAFVFAVNLQVPGREHYNAIFYYATEDPVPPGSLFYRFIHEDDAFRNSRFKLINRVVKGPWIVRATVGNHAACLLGKALTCHYLKGENYLEIDVDIGSSALANAIIHLALGYVTSVSVDMAFMVESQSEEELPERLLGAVRIAQIDMASAVNMDSLVEREQNERAAATGAGTGGGFEWRRLGRGLHPKVSGQAKNAKVEDGREGKN